MPLPRRLGRIASLTVRAALTVALLAAAGLAAGTTPAAALGFPRLGIQWPSSSESDATLARYDFVVLGGAEKSRIPRVKALHPDEILLTTDNGIEVSFGAIKNLPTSWLLTQVGSTLTAPVDATAKVLPVGNTTASGKTLFGVGDLVVIENEVAAVEAVTANSITVQRGAYRPAASHPAGARVAATITYWPGTVVMDMSTYCPKVTVDAAAGPETWSEYHGRTSAARVLDADWDGIWVDRLDGDQSWLVTSSFTPTAGRTIDPDRSNRIVTDGYDAFDAAWNAGLRVYEQKLRGLVGPSRIIVGNGAWPNYDLLNGTFFEGFPDADGGIMAIGWRDALFTPDVSWGVTGKGSYTQWATSALQPNLTTLETFQPDDGGADGKTPDYRHMRFALTSALMGDGYHLYRINGLLLGWFDEYDGGGIGTGYLGEALGAAKPALAPLTTPDLVAGDGAFESSAQLNAWKLVTSTGYAATKSLDTVQRASGASSARIDVTQSGGTTWRANVQHQVAVTGGQPYTLSFKARADRPLPVYAFMERATGQTSFGTVNLSTQWKTFELPATPSASDAAAKLILSFGGQVGTLWLDDVKLQAGNQRDVMRRDFEHGVALVNATDRPIAIDLGGIYRKIRGNQVPTVNDGSLVSSVTLPSLDGLVLLRLTDTPPPPGNSAPVAVADSFTLDEDTARSIAAPGVLANDTDAEGDTLWAVKVAGPAHGTLAFDPDGSFTYTPAPNFNGSDSFTYKAYDGGAYSNTATVSLTVDPVDEPPPIWMPVYRFYNRNAGVHFYTASESEKQRVIERLSATYVYEGVSYRVNAANPTNNAPLYRFYNKTTGVHFYTASPTERDNVAKTLSSVFTYEGVSYYVSTAPTAMPVYRFYNKGAGVHFYTASAAEKENVIKNLSATHPYEGIGYYIGQ